MPTRTAWRPTRRGRTARHTAAGGVAAGRAVAVRPVRPADGRAVLRIERSAFLRMRSGSSSYAEPLCQSLAGPVVDDLVGREILGALEPAGLEASLAAIAEVERERAEGSRHWQLRRERARYEVERAARQYQAVEPENRLVARELERRWEESLKVQRQLEEEYERWQRTAPGRLSTADEEAIRSLAADLPTVWRAGTTTAAERQRPARLLLDGVRRHGGQGQRAVEVELAWAGGLVRRHTLSRPVKRYDLQSDYPRLVERLRALCAERLSSAAIAERLNAEGFRPPKRTDRFTGSIVQRLTSRLGLMRRQRHGSPAGLGRDEYRRRPWRVGWGSRGTR